MKLIKSYYLFDINFNYKPWHVNPIVCLFDYLCSYVSQVYKEITINKFKLHVVSNLLPSKNGPTCK